MNSPAAYLGVTQQPTISMIDVIIQDERGIEVARFADVQIVDALRNNAPTDSKCLHFIDPYGDTVFNRYQASILTKEIHTASARLAPSDRERAEALGSFVRRVVDGIHLYVKIGSSPK